jgi:hypothetical protein
LSSTSVSEEAAMNVRRLPVCGALVGISNNPDIAA